MTRIKFETISNPANLAIPAYAVDTGERDHAGIVAAAIARKSGGYRADAVLEGYNNTAVFYKTTVVKRDGRVVGEVQFVLPRDYA